MKGEKTIFSKVQEEESLNQSKVEKIFLPGDLLNDTINISKAYESDSDDSEAVESANPVSKKSSTKSANAFKYGNPTSGSKIFKQFQL